MENFRLPALVFFITGLILPILIMIAARFFLTEPLQIGQINDLSALLGLICEIIAIIFAALSWQNKLSKVIVVIVILLTIGIGVFLLIKPGSAIPKNAQTITQTPQVTSSSQSTTESNK
jgi:hypothetical protein